MENAFVINDLMNSMLTKVEENLSANSSNAIQQKTNLQKVNETISSNDEQPSEASKLFSVNKTEFSLKNEFVDIPSVTQKAGKESLTKESFDVLKDCDALLKIHQKTYQQKVNEIVIPNCKQSSEYSKLSNVMKAESSMNNELEYVPTVIQNVMKGSFITENITLIKDNGASFNKVFHSIENNEVEGNTPKSEQQYDIASTDAAKECLKSVNSDSNIKVSADSELEKQSNFSKGDNDEMFSAKKNNEIRKLESEILTDDKLLRKSKKLIEVFSFSSLERELTQDYESYSDDSEFFLTKSPGIDSFFQKDIESCSSLKKTSSNKSKILQESNEPKNKPMSSKLRWFRSNRVSPDQLQSEVKTKSKAKRLASTFAKGLRKPFNNAWKAYKSRRRLNLIVLCPVPLFFMHL